MLHRGQQLLLDAFPHLGVHDARKVQFREAVDETGQVLGVPHALEDGLELSSDGGDVLLLAGSVDALEHADVLSLGSLDLGGAHACHFTLKASTRLLARSRTKRRG